MKRILCLLLAVLFLLACGCGSKETGKDPESAEPAAVLPGENQVQDGAGRILNLPEQPEQATMASVYAVSVPFISALGLSGRTVAVNPKTKFWNTADPELSAKTVGRGTVDLEALAALNPTALIHRSNDPETVAAVENIGIDVLCITVENMEDIRSTLRLLGKYFGAEERAETVINWIQGKLDRVASVVAQIPEEERVTALLMGGELGRVAGSDMLQTWMIETAGGVCVADEGKDHNWINVGVEKIFTWNPEFLFCTSSTGLDYTVDEVLSDPAWSAVEAVKREQVYVMPAKIDSWDIPGISCVLGIEYMLYTMYPEYFSAQDLQKEIDDYYTFMFDTTFDAGTLGYVLEG